MYQHEVIMYQKDLLGLSPDDALCMCQKIETSVGNLRRGMFQRHNDLLQMYLSAEDKGKLHEDQLKTLEANLHILFDEMAAMREQVQQLSSIVDQLRCIVQYPIESVKMSRKVISFSG